MKAIDRLSVIQHKSKINKDWKHNDLFRILRKNDIWITAYKNIKTDNRTLTLGIKKKTLDGLSIKKLVKLQNEVINENYQFKSINKISTLKLNQKKRPTELLTIDDKIVQEVIYMILESIYKPCFSKKSFSFPIESEIYDLFKDVKSRFQSVNWMIKGNIKSILLNIDNKRLCNILGKKIQDIRFINLIRKLLKHGIFDYNQFTKFSFEVQQENMIYLIFANIYFNDLDKWIENKIKLLYKIYKNQYNKVDINLSFKIEYVRYINDWMIGIKGNQILAKELKIEISHFIMTYFKQPINSAKIEIIDLRSGKVEFVRYEIYKLRNMKVNSLTKFNIRHKKNDRLRFDIPMNFVLQKIKEKGYIKKLVKGYRSISKVDYTTLNDITIIKHFAQIWKEFFNYYSNCSNRSKLQYIYSLLHISCAMTLSHRHRSSIKKIFNKYGKFFRTNFGKYRIEFIY